MIFFFLLSLFTFPYWFSFNLFIFASLLPILRIGDFWSSDMLQSILYACSRTYFPYLHLHFEAEQKGHRYGMIETVVCRCLEFNKHIGTAGYNVGQRIAAAYTGQLGVIAILAIVDQKVVVHWLTMIPCSAIYARTENWNVNWQKLN